MNAHDISDLEIPAADLEFLATLPPTPREQRIQIERMRREGGRVMGGPRPRKARQRDLRREALADKERRIELYAAQVEATGEIHTYEPEASPELREAANNARTGELV